MRLREKVIMPSEYTDEIENSSYTRRAFSMGKKSKYSAEEKISILDEVLRDGAPKVMAKYNISQDAIHRWRLLYKYQGLSGLQTEQRYQSYSREFKQSLVEKYLRSNESQLLFAIKHGLQSKTQLQSWIIQYNESNLKAYMPGKRDSKMSGRKTSFDERLTIIEELIKHDVNYNWAVETYHVSYQQVYGWYQKYLKSGNNPESLRDRRGKAKPEKEWTEVDRLKAENRLLKAKLQNQEMEIAFAKKLVEIRNREVDKGTNSGQLKS